MEECERFDEVFNEHSQGQEEIVSVEVPKALRALGFKLTFEVVQSVIGRVDVDDTGTLSISEFRKMIRMLEEREESFYRRAFQNYAKAKGSEVASYSKAQEIARSMGFHLHKHHMGLESEEAAEEAKISCEAFTRACCKVAQEMREVFRRNGGFSDEELQELQNMFHRYDSRKSGRIANKDLVRLVENVCPSLAREKSLRPTLQEMMQACQEFNGCLRFKDFLKLMRLILDFQDKERAQTEVSIIKSTGFTLSEVQEFRELFLEVDEGTGVVTFEACRSMIHRITPLGDNLTHQLKRIFEIQTRKKPSHRAHEADFPEYLGGERAGFWEANWCCIHKVIGCGEALELVEVENWQFAWAEEQKEACCKTVGVGCTEEKVVEYPKASEAQFSSDQSMAVGVATWAPPQPRRRMSSTAQMFGGAGLEGHYSCDEQLLKGFCWMCRQTEESQGPLHPTPPVPSYVKRKVCCASNVDCQRRLRGPEGPVEKVVSTMSTLNLGLPQIPRNPDKEGWSQSEKMQRNMEAQMEDDQETITHTKESLARFSEENQRLEKERDALKAKLEYLQKDLEEAKAKAAAAQEEAAKAQAQPEKAVEDEGLKEFQAKIGALEAQCREASAAQRGLQDELSQAERALAAAEVEKEELREQTRQLEAQIKEEASASAKKLEKAVEKLELAEAERDRLKDDANKQEAGAGEAEALRAKVELEASLQKAEEQRMQVEAALKEKEEAFAKLREEAQEGEEKAQQKERELVELRAQKEEWEKVAQAAKAQQAQEADEDGKQAASIETLQAEKAQLESLLEAAKQEAAEKEPKLQAFQAEKAQLESLLEAAKQQAATSLSSVEIAQAEKAKLEELLGAAQKSWKEAEEKQRRANRSLEEVEEQLRSSREEAQAHLQAQLSGDEASVRLKERLREMETTTSQAESAKSALEETLKEKNEASGMFKTHRRGGQGEIGATDDFDQERGRREGAPLGPRAPRAAGLQGGSGQASSREGRGLSES
ncbi:Laminin-like protein epi-1 [Durusdinium trenchii]|uniref:Laminin-like protein epi-1 n=1 Tax=Durusdinium trenchii TaxID=1381693 RepID=A0ABP0P138_9DINO